MVTKPRQFFTPEEDDLLRQIYPTYETIDDLLSAFPGRLANTMIGRAKRLGIKRTIRCRPDMTRSGGEFGYLAQSWVAPGGDARHVSACLAEGGFPHARDLNGRTVWVWPVGRMAA